MQKIVCILLASVVAGLIAGATIFADTPDSSASAAISPTTAPAIDLEAGWRLLQEGEAKAAIGQDATYPTDFSPRLLRIAVTKTAGPGEGRAGAVSDIQFAVHEGEWCDVTFSAITKRASVGLVFSLENPDGKVLARTTLPEVGGRARRGAAATAPAVWTKYLVSLHVRSSDPSAHAVITPIEPTDVWIDGLTLTPRQAEK